MLLASLSFSPAAFPLFFSRRNAKSSTFSMPSFSAKITADSWARFKSLHRIRKRGILPEKSFVSFSRPAAGKMLRMVRRLTVSYKNDHIRIPYSPPVSDQQSEIPFYQPPLRIPNLHRCLGTLFPLIFAARSTQHADPRSYAENRSD